MSLYQSDLEDMKLWRLRKALTAKRKAVSYSMTHNGGLHRLMTEHLTEEIQRIESELRRRSINQQSGKTDG